MKRIPSKFARPAYEVMDTVLNRPALRDMNIAIVSGVLPEALAARRTGRMKFSAGLMIRIHEVHQLPFKELRGMLAEQ